MASNVNLEGFQRDKYFSRSWALLTLESGWIKPVLLLALGMMVPIVGPLVVLGYALEWARLTAWGVNAAPKQKGADIGGCLAAGWRGFVVALGWGLAVALVGTALANIPRVGDVLMFVWSIFGIYLELLILVGIVRSAVYQKIGPGYRADRIWEMGAHDVGGLMRILGVVAIWGLIASAIGILLVVVMVGSMLPAILPYADYFDYIDLMSDEEAVQLFSMVMSNVLGVLGPWLIVTLFVTNILTVIQQLITYTCVGLWMRQFNVPAWGRSEDPLPPFVDATSGAASYASSAAPVPLTGPAPAAPQPAPTAPAATQPAPTAPAATQPAPTAPAATWPAPTAPAAPQPADSAAMVTEVVPVVPVVPQEVPATNAAEPEAAPQPATETAAEPEAPEPEAVAPQVPEPQVPEPAAADAAQPEVPAPEVPAESPLGDLGDLKPVEVGPMEPLAPVQFEDADKDGDAEKSEQ